MTKLKRTTLLMLLGACLAAAGCGSDDEGDPIPADSAAELESQLDGVQARLDNGSVGACDDILAGPRGPNVDAVNQTISQLPDGVDEDVRAGLQDGFDKLWTLVEDRCTELREAAESQQQEQPEPEPETETVAPPETETVAPPETETVAPPETDTVPSPETETLPPVEPPADEGGDGQRRRARS